MRFQFFHTRSHQTGVSSAPEIDVQGAFTGGGTFPQNYTDDNKSEFQDNVTVLRGTHTIKFGGRFRNDRLKQQSTSNFNGRFIFSAVPGGDSAIGVYQQNQLLAAQGDVAIRDRGVGIRPSEFLLTAGNPAAQGKCRSTPESYVQDEWRIKPNLLAERRVCVTKGRPGSRITPISRRGSAWPGRRADAGPIPKTVFRAARDVLRPVHFQPADERHAAQWNQSDAIHHPRVRSSFRMFRTPPRWPH